MEIPVNLFGGNPKRFILLFFPVFKIFQVLVDFWIGGGVRIPLQGFLSPAGGGYQNLLYFVICAVCNFSEGRHSFVLTPDASHFCIQPQRCLHFPVNLCTFYLKRFALTSKSCMFCPKCENVCSLNQKLFLHYF